jgi:hypothetical protein
VNQAKAQFTQAKELFDEATRMSKENEGLKTRADNEMKILIAKKEEGKTKGVPEKAGSDWNLAEQGLRDAEDQMQRGDYASAFETIRQATGQFQAAFDAAKQNDEIAKAEEDRSQREKDALAADQVKAKSAQKPTDAEPEVVKVAPPKAGKAGDKGGAKVPSGRSSYPRTSIPFPMPSSRSSTPRTRSSSPRTGRSSRIQDSWSTIRPRRRSRSTTAKASACRKT